ncbi:prepilin-type N-terminal cleavage/methylation domain-containing protein [Candidatus Saccharibacteria bacterium]|nr:prepilin-type N-terminal cleavage/methylation domain-containing protein [Candidatus Saccharibacteria bacterium]
MAGIFRRNGQRAGFTIVELIVVIIVIGILAAVTILGYGAWRQNVAEAQVKSDLTQAASAMQAALNDQDVYPTQIPSTFQPSDGVQIVLARSSSQSYCINGVSMSHPSLAYYVDEKSAGSPRQGSCGPLSLSVKTMSIGSSHACYLNTDGGVYCWGANDQGNLGTGDFTASQVPKKVVNLSGGSIRSIAVGSGGHSCAVTSNGKAYCWGRE